MVKVKKMIEISEDSMETLIDALDILRAIVNELGNDYLDNTFNYPDILDDIKEALDDIYIKQAEMPIFFI